LYALAAVPRFALVLALGLVALAGGCKKKIGDPCVRSTDCSIRGDRICDLSHRVDAQGTPTPGGQGECTIESCGANTCPKEAECVKVYGSDFLTVACDPTREDRATMGSDPDCLDGVCPPRDDCQANEVCLPEGLCADEITARTSCRKRCKKDNDCRAGYECVRTGARGIYHAPDLDHPGKVEDVRICTPVSSTQGG
jgi:hypothetical protein